ncbi:hypothetical protein A9Q79_10280 [Methylophaga sp. 42_25_T18]|nr:hypothetical protein A9Q79_10280 [Methylophaga sp. 42_25_T18]
MKKQDSCQASRFNAIALKRFKRRLKSKLKSKQRRRGQSRSNLKNKTDHVKAKIFGGKGYVISAPRYISIYEVNDNVNTYVATMKFVEDIRQNYGKRKCIFDFSATECFTAASLVVIYATIEEAYNNGDERGVVLLPKSGRIVKDMIALSNLRMLIEGKNITYTLSGDEFLPVITGHGRVHLEEIMDHIQKKIYDDNLTDKENAEQEYVYCDAVSETVHNVGAHAYPNRRDEEKKWWVLCHFDVNERQLYLAIYDSGVGIPKTVVKNPWFTPAYKKQYPIEYKELIKRSGGETNFLFVKYISEAQMVGMSMVGDVTGTKMSKHGQGSKSIIALVKETSDGKLWVFSGRGMYNAVSNEAAVVCELPETFQGTLVQWNINYHA